MAPTPKRILGIRDAILAEASKARDCTRCDGEGSRETPNWVVVTDNKSGLSGKICFRCRGTGVEPPRKLTDPLRVRYAVANRLLPFVEAGDLASILDEQDRQEEQTPYWPILVDVFQRARGAAMRRRLLGSAPKRERPRTLMQAMTRAPSYVLDTLEKHHPDASYEDLCEAFGVDPSWVGEV